MAEGLTPKQEAFVQAIISGKTQSDAYRLAYDTSKMKPSSVHELASVLMTDVKISSRIKGIKEELAKHFMWTREDSVRELTSVINDMSARCSDRTAAVKVLNEMYGFNAPIKHDVNGTVTHEMAIEMLK